MLNEISSPNNIWPLLTLYSRNFTHSLCFDQVLHILFHISLSHTTETKTVWLTPLTNYYLST